MKNHSTLLTILTVLTILTLQTPSSLASFPDAPADAWFTPYVEEVVESGLMEGNPDGTFGSWEPMNRAEFAKTIVQLKQSLEENWWEKHLAEIIFLSMNLLGWIALLMFMNKFSERPPTIQKKQPEYPRNPIQKDSRFIATENPSEPPNKLENDFQNEESNKPEQKTNWWL
jgi:hypothetical protein